MPLCATSVLHNFQCRQKSHVKQSQSQKLKWLYLSKTMCTLLVLHFLYFYLLFHIYIQDTVKSCPYVPPYISLPIYNPISIPNISHPRIYTPCPPPQIQACKVCQTYETSSFSSVLMHFVSAIYVRSFSISGNFA